MATPITQVDAFADRPFAGNPAAVCLLDRPAEPAWMQAVAMEMNLSETAFLVAEGPGEYHLRWFTPEVEVDLCGHATLASAHLLWEDGRVDPDGSIRFRTRSGTLAATRQGEWIELDFPALPLGPAIEAGSIAGALGVEVVGAWSTRFDALIEVKSEAIVRALEPDQGRLAGLDFRGIIATARADRAGAGYDFVSRFFAPRCGVAEDPVTGSAHCALAPFWAARLGRDELVGYQASRRGGVVRVRHRGERVILGGRAVTTIRGEILVDPSC